jgi:hypothetical protein
MQVDEFHSHPYGDTNVTVPGPIRECDDPHCSVARVKIERMAQFPDNWLKRQISLHECAIQNEISMLSRLREAVALKSRNLT